MVYAIQTPEVRNISDIKRKVHYNISDTKKESALQYIREQNKVHYEYKPGHFQARL